MALTAKAIDNLHPQERPYKKADRDGLTLIIKPNGSKLWRLRYRFSGKPKTFSLGPYPTVSLLEARKRTMEAKENIRQGIDPSAEKQRYKREKILNAHNTFQAIAEEWHKHNADSWNARHAANIMSRLKRDVFELIGSMPIAEIATKDIAATIKAIEDRGAGEMARRALQNCGQIFRYAIQTGRAKYDVTAGLSRGFLKRRQKRHYATIEVKDLPDLIKKISFACWVAHLPLLLIAGI